MQLHSMEGFLKDFDVSALHQLVQEAPLKENGWTLDSEGPIHKSFSENTIKVFKKQLAGESVMSIKYDAFIKGVDINKWTKVGHIDHRKKWDPFLRHMEQTIHPEGWKLVYLQAKMPFPLTDRDMVQRSYSICNKTNPELVTKYNLPQTDHTYYLNMVEPAISDKYPEKREFVRGETKQATLIEEIPGKEGGIRIRSVNNSNIKGSVPTGVLNALAGKGPYKILSKQLEFYPKLVLEGLI